MSRLLILALLVMVGCNGDSRPDHFLGEQCSVSFAKVEDMAGKLYIPLEGSACYCRQYLINEHQVGPLRNSEGRVVVTTHDVSYCNLIKGYHPKTDTRLVVFLDWMRVLFNQHNHEQKQLERRDPPEWGHR